ncbi:MAG: hypothetical protein ABI193_06675 [Minicystis sp.]
MERKRPRKPIKQPPVLFEKTQELIEVIEKELGYPFVAYWSHASLANNDVSAFYEVLSTIGHPEQAGLMIKSDGGNGKASLRIVHLLRGTVNRLTALVPLNCASAATMLALGADEIQMGPLAYLTPVDTSLTHDLCPVDVDRDRVAVSQDELTRVVRLWRAENGETGQNPYQQLFPHIHPLVIGAVDRSSSLSIKICKEILSYHMSDSDLAERISNQLNASYPAHSYPITAREALRLGLNITPLPPQLNDRLIDLSSIYSEMGQKAVTDYDEQNHHDNEILTVVERKGVQIFYQLNKDWHYRKEERRWISMNDESSWHMMRRQGRKLTKSLFHIR